MVSSFLIVAYSDTYLGNTGSGNGLLPYGTKPLHELMLTYHEWYFVAFT